MTTGCNGGGTCHASTVAGNLKMGTPAETYTALIDVKAMGTNLNGMGTHCKDTDQVRVVPGDPDKSLFFHKVEADTPNCGLHMPPGSKLTPEQLTQIRTWIKNGAKND